MSEPKLISPLLDNYLMGDPISDHHGVRCCPAIIKNTDNRFIVKIISIPASQVQLDALLLAGAYSSQASALAYFKELAAGVAEEAEILKKLAKFEGFVPYDGLQIVPMEGKVGYDVYLVSPYKRSLERQLKKGPMTHLKAVNLGLDLCAAMVMCRRAGFLYVDLKPGNIFINGKGEFCVGDLGFIRISSLKYASLPDKYRSAYTAPELEDALASINETIDTYAIGMILYQVFNDNNLPRPNADGSWPVPVHADKAIAEIILKAIDADPAQRWQDPMQMGQALVSYMQGNVVNDVPIGQPIPEEPIAEEPTPDEEVPASEEPVAEEVPAEDSPVEEAAEGASVEETPEEPAAENPTEDETTVPVAVAVDVEAPAENPVVTEELPEPAEEPVPQESPVEDAPAEEIPAEEPAPEEEPAQEAAAENAPEEIPQDTMPELNPEDIDYNELSDETSDILAQADELLAMEMPEPVVAPQPIEVPMPEPLVLPKDEPEEEPQEPVAAVEIPQEPQEEPAEEPVEEAEEEFIEEEDEEPAPVSPEKPKKKLPIGRIIVCVILILLLLAGAAAGSHYYQNVYIQTVDSLEIQGGKDNLTVVIETKTDESLLTAICSDPYGNSRLAQFTGGKAHFEDLNPDTIYKITIQIEGFHQLVGDLTDTYTTPAQTNIIQFEATAGSETGSVILTFAVDGQDTKNWTVTYSTEGENQQSVSFSGHIVTINNLEPGKEYTFTLSSSDDLYIVGTDTVKFTASAPVYAQDLAIISCTSEGLTATWNAPEGVTVEKWIVRCYNDNGYDKTIETSELTATFTDLNPSDAFTVEVLAEGMSMGVRTYLSARSATITAVIVDNNNPLSLTVTWEFTGTAPVGGWIVIYNQEGSDRQELIQTTENTIVVSPALPNTVYHFTVQSADGTTVVDNSFTCKSGSITVFSGYGVTADNMNFQMCKTPSYADWKWFDVPSSNYKYTYAPGEKASVVASLNRSSETSYELVEVTFYVRDANGELVSASTVTSSWSTMWEDGYCELDMGPVPEEPGSYTLAVYFNGMAACQIFFTVR